MLSNGGSAIFQKRGVIKSTWEGGALGGVRGRKEDRLAGSTTTCSKPGFAHYLHDHHSGVRWHHSRAWNWGSCLCAVGWLGSTIPHPVCQLLAGHPSSRREPWRSYYFAQHGGAWCQMEEGVAESSNEWKSESFVLYSFLLLWLSILESVLDKGPMGLKVLAMRK